MLVRSALSLLQRLPDTVEEEGVLLDALLLQVLLEPLEQVLRHLKGYRSLIPFHRRFSLLRLVEFCDNPCHVLAQGLAGRLLMLPEAGMKFNWDGSAEVFHILCHMGPSFPICKPSIPKAMDDIHSQIPTKMFRETKRKQQAIPPPWRGPA